MEYFKEKNAPAHAINSDIHNAGDTRPAHLANTGYLMDEKAIDTLRYIYERGMDPVDLATRLKQGIEAEQLYIIPYPEERESLEKHFKLIVESVLPMEADPEGARRRVEAFRAIGERAMEEAKKDPSKPVGVGFGNARPELDWVKPAPIRPTGTPEE